MDDLQLVRGLGDETPLPDAAALAPARAKFLAGVAERTAPRPRRARFALVGASAVGLAAAAAAVVALVPGTEPAGPGGGGVAVSSAAEDPTGDPVRLLSHAARVARAEPAVEPRADQFVYTRSRNRQGEREIWLSVDGTHDGLLRQQGDQIPFPGCRDGRRAVYKGPEPLPGVTEPCEPSPAYRPDLPTDVDGMLAYLGANASGEPGSVNSRGKDVFALISEQLLMPASRAALFEAAARTPGLSVVGDARDASGRPGVGITWPTPPGSDPRAEPVVVVFDRTSYELLGTNSSAILEQFVVDAAGQGL
ncbi:CU044_5270 family protein [Saccharothrix syringae]|uniref:CU044_5270 family protein n=1 Tax=Saccharothrix syringae TaxID=103733 RepID=A0A5Q0H8J4_SACSY|nr:CU044_5270 family protein [Saccharothrix syringae]QFZ22235.1 hypothetical protein EKG83_36775 [Saccharothrix syringae]